MSELPCVGAGITVVDPGPNTNDVFRKRPDGRPYTPKTRSGRWSSRDPKLRLLKAYVTEVIHFPAVKPEHDGFRIVWKCGTREGHVYQGAQGHTWITGHGPQARGALLAQRALEPHR